MQVSEHKVVCIYDDVKGNQFLRIFSFQSQNKIWTIKYSRFETCMFQIVQVHQNISLELSIKSGD
jgi:hypothetical protein